MAKARTEYSKSTYPQPTGASQTFGTGRKRGILNLKTLLERDAFDKTALKMKHNPYQVNIEMTENLIEDYMTARADGNHKYAVIYAELASKYLERTINKLLPNRAIENEKESTDYISFLPKVITTEDEENPGDETVMEIETVDQTTDDNIISNPE